MLLNLRARTYWLISLILFILAIGFVLLCIYSPNGSNTVFIVLMTIDLILMTFAIQIAIQKSIKYKPKPIEYDEKVYENTTDLDDALLKNGFELRKRHIGRSYLKIEDNNAYKAVIIDDSSKYFDNVEEPKDLELSERLDKCTRFTGVEIFLNPTEEIENKIYDFSFQIEKVYYTALIKKDNKFICRNYIEPDKNHKDNFIKLLNMLGLSEIEIVKEETNE